MEKKSSSTTLRTIRYAKAITVSLTIASALMFPIGIQLFFGLMQFGGAGAEFAGEELWWGLGAMFIPGQELFVAGYIVSAIIGFLSMLFALLVYTLSTVFWWRNGGWMTFGICMLLSIAVFASTFPWVLVWLFLVVRAQK